MRNARTMSLMLLVVLGGCEFFDEPKVDGTGDTGGGPADTDVDTDTDTDTDTDVDMDTDTDVDTDTDTDADTDTDTTYIPPPDWTVSYHPCVGNRTDTMWFDDDDTTVFVGCGTTTTGYGAYKSLNRGLTWAPIQTNPPYMLDNFRVQSIHRSADGWVYLSGINTLGSERVVRIDDSVSPATLETVFESTGQLWNSMQVGTFRRNSAGFAVAESLTGTDLAFRESDAVGFQDGYPWWGGGPSYQILDMVLDNDEFYAVGSTITQPPTVMLPPPGGQLPGDFTFMTVTLTGSTDFAGELWGLDVDNGRFIAGGVDQDRDVGYVFYSDDPYNANAWKYLDVGGMLPGQPTWMRGACRNGDTLVAVGEYSMRSDGIVLRSDDNGATWSDITGDLPVDPPSLHRCKVFDDGDLAVTGMDGYFGVFDPAP